MATTPRKTQQPTRRPDGQQPAPPPDGQERPRPIRLPVQDACCEGPCDTQWVKDDECSFWYETRYCRLPLPKQRDREHPNEAIAPSPCDYIEFRIVYEHRLCRVGKRLGSLLYTITLLPGEKVTLYQSERFVRITSVQDRFSVDTTFAQFLSRIHRARLTSELDLLSAKLSDLCAGSAASEGLGGMLDLSTGTKIETADPASLNVNHVSEQFHQSVVQAARMTDAERSVVISTYAEDPDQNVTARTLENDNPCRAVTYFVRKVVEPHVVTTGIADVSYQINTCKTAPDWHPIGDLGRRFPAIHEQMKAIMPLLPSLGAVAPRQVTVALPTDGTVYDPELAHCSSCEPARALAEEIELNRKQAEAYKLTVETQLLETELERRRQLLLKQQFDPFDPVPAPAQC